MNYSKQLEEMLGIKFGQTFRLQYENGNKIDGYYRISPDLIIYKCDAGSNYWYITKDIKLNNILLGLYEIIELPFIPKRGDTYYFYNPENRYGYCNYSIGLVNSALWTDDVININRSKIGNCFKTKEEAVTIGKRIYENIGKEYLNVSKATDSKES